jgi:hypothetical protein
MIIELEKWEYDLIKLVSDENCTDYEVKEKDGKWYIDKYSLMCALDETQEYRRYAESKVIELDRALNSYNYDELLDRYLRAEGSLVRAKKKIEELKTNLEIATSVFNEDHWDRAYEEGFTNE